MSCCCCCCGGGPSFKDIVQTPPTTAEVRRFMEALQTKEDPDGVEDTCCFCLPKSVLCCFCRALCPCCFGAPERVAVVKKMDVVEAATSTGSASFLGNEAAVKYISKLFVSRGSNKVRMEYLSAGLVLLSAGSIEDKLSGLYEAFAHAVGGIFNRQALEKTVASLVKTCIDIASKVSDYLSGALIPGGKAVRLMLKALNGAVGGFFVKKRVDEMLAGDKDGDGEISVEEFKAVAMQKSSIVRKTLQWVDNKTSVLRGEREEDTCGRLEIDGTSYWALLNMSDKDEEQKIVYWDSEDALRTRNFNSAVGEISLQEPCSIGDDGSEDDTTFVIVDRDTKRWSVRAPDKALYYEWYDAVDEYCDADMDERELQGEGNSKCCGLFCC